MLGGWDLARNKGEQLELLFSLLLLLRLLLLIIFWDWEAGEDTPDADLRGRNYDIKDFKTGKS